MSDSLASPAADPPAPLKDPVSLPVNDVAAAARRPTSPEEGAEEPPRTLDRLDEIEQGGRLDWISTAPSWLFSALVHMALILALGMMMLPEITDQVRNLVATTVSEEEGVAEVEEIDEATPSLLEAETTEVTVPSEVEAMTEAIGLADTSDVAAPSMSVGLVDLTPGSGETALTGKIGAALASGLAGRGEGMRQRLAIQAGGTAESEAAVARALEWLAAHQNPDGSWSFNHTLGNCQGRCSKPGSLGRQANLAATGLGLLPFMGAGNTQREGKYKELVQAGLYYLINNMHEDSGVPGALTDPGQPGMYSHGICSIVLCEAYAMTSDKALEGPAQASLNFIAYAQDPVGGGWRYRPRTPGDTSVVGWQMMALKSGQLAYLRIDPRTVAGASHFLDTVQTASGAGYGYTAPQAGGATTAIGLLCRMYLGWKRDHAALQRGVATLLERGPSPNDMYFNYYATQVLHHYGGEEWDAWNPKMRDFLVREQAALGHERGSWHFEGAHGADDGGRHYSTAMATMVLEVYYRHMPLYQDQAGEEEFQD